MNTDDTDDSVSPDDALLQRYFDGTLADDEASAFESRMEIDSTLADDAARFAGLFAALETRSVDLSSESPVAGALLAWRPQAAVAPEKLGSTVRIFLLLDALLGGVLAALLVARGPVDVFKSWVLGVKDVLVFAHSLAPSPQEAVVLVPTALAILALGGLVAGYGVRRLLLSSGSAS